MRNPTAEPLSRGRVAGGEDVSPVSKKEVRRYDGARG
jgi:hypothetical protein